MTAMMRHGGVEWFGPIAETWDVAPLRVFLKLRRDIVGVHSTNTKLLSLTLQGVIERDLDNPTGKMPASFDGYQRISAGEMVFCLFDMDETPRTVGLALQDGMLTSAYSVFQPKSDLWARYLYYFFLHVDEYKRLKPFYKGLRKTIRPGPFLSIQVPRPPEGEAKKIVAHLDCSIARIDALSSKKARFIDLLREKRRSLITHAVTRGLDACVTMKQTDSASDLRVPSHWNVVKFWTVVRQVSRTGKPDVDLLSVYLDRGVIPYSEGGGVVHKPSETLDGYQLVEPGNLVLNNQQAWRGSVGVSKHRGLVSPAYFVFELSSKLDPGFANYQLREQRFVEEMMLSSQGVGDIQRQLKWPLLRSAKLFLPPLHEQRAIVAFLDRMTARIDTLIAKTERSIELLLEHRSALIAAAVVGNPVFRNEV